MSLARHPTWIQVKQHIYHPTWKAKLIDFLFRMLVSTAVYFISNSTIWFTMSIIVTALLPSLVVGLLDIFLRIQFSLMALLITILTLQIPVAILATAQSEIGVVFGSLLLLFWIVPVGIYIYIQLMIYEESNKANEPAREAKTE